MIQIQLCTGKLVAHQEFIHDYEIRSRLTQPRSTYVPSRCIDPKMRPAKKQGSWEKGLVRSISFNSKTRRFVHF